jgi:hypothetical protein
MHKYLITLAVLGSFFLAAKVSGAEPGWERGVVKFGAERERIQNTPILERPYRPLHVYGNVVRRRHYQGRALPTLRDMPGSGSMLVGAR